MNGPVRRLRRIASRLALPLALLAFPAGCGREGGETPFAATAGEAGLGPVPALVVEAPESLEGVAGRVRSLDPEVLRTAMRLTGVDRAGAPIRVVLAPERSALARSAPAWVAGFAAGASGTVVLFPARIGRYPDRGLEPLLGHEVAHVLVARAARGRPVPRWFDEGVAMAAGRERDVGDRARVVLAVLTRGRLPLARLDAAFAGGSGHVEAAYALARDLVRELVARHGEQVTAAILAGLARDQSFEAAFLDATGGSLADFEASYWRRRTFWDRWLPIVTSSVMLWGAITFLALAAFRRRAARDAAVRRRWEAEERAAIEVALAEVESPTEGKGPTIH